MPILRGFCVLFLVLLLLGLLRVNRVRKTQSDDDLPTFGDSVRIYIGDVLISFCVVLAVFYIGGG